MAALRDLMIWFFRVSHRTLFTSIRYANKSPLTVLFHLCRRFFPNASEVFRVVYAANGLFNI